MGLIFVRLWRRAGAFRRRRTRAGRCARAKPAAILGSSGEHEVRATACNDCVVGCQLALVCKTFGLAAVVLEHSTVYRQLCRRRCQSRDSTTVRIRQRDYGVNLARARFRRLPSSSRSLTHIEQKICGEHDVLDRISRVSRAVMAATPYRPPLIGEAGPSGVVELNAFTDPCPDESLRRAPVAFRP